MLRELQSDFRAVITADDPRAVARLATAVLGDGIDPRRRLQVYRNHYVATLTDVMGATYPAVRALVGGACFAATARYFIDLAPPRSPCLFEYGERFPEFLRGNAKLRALPYLADVAHFEWAVHCARHSRRLPPAAAALVRAIPRAHYPMMTLVLQPSISLIDSVYPLTRIVETALGATSSVVSLDEGGDRVVVWRAADGVVWRSTDRAEFAVLAALAKGATMKEACAAATASDGAALTAAFAFLLDAGLVTEIGFWSQVLAVRSAMP